MDTTDCKKVERKEPKKVSSKELKEYRAPLEGKERTTAVKDFIGYKPKSYDEVYFTPKSEEGEYTVIDNESNLVYRQTEKTKKWYRQFPNNGGGVYSLEGDQVKVSVPNGESKTIPLEDYLAVKDKIKSTTELIGTKEVKEDIWDSVNSASTFYDTITQEIGKDNFSHEEIDNGYQDFEDHDYEDVGVDETYTINGVEFIIHFSGSDFIYLGDKSLPEMETREWEDPRQAANDILAYIGGQA